MTARPTGPATPISDLRELLEKERAAVVAGDVATIEALGEPKRRAVEALRASDASGPEVDDLSRHARLNVVLLRHLVSCLRVLAWPLQTDVRYGPNGSRVQEAGARSVARV